MSNTPFKMKGISPLKHPHLKKKVRKSHTHKKKKLTSKTSKEMYSEATQGIVENILDQTFNIAAKKFKRK